MQVSRWKSRGGHGKLGAMEDKTSPHLPASLSLTSVSPDQTSAIAARLGAVLAAGDTILLQGPVGVGKSHFCRALIQSRLSSMGRMEDVPSPSFTLVQTYDLGGVELWHADLYRLGDMQEIVELGLEDAFSQAICLVEWAERLGDMAPEGALRLTFAAGANEEERQLTLEYPAQWTARLAAALS